MSSALPTTTPGSIAGILEIVQDFGGDVDAARIAADYGLELDDLLPPVQAAELLGFVTTPEGNIQLTDAGKKFLKASLTKRKTLFRDQLLKTPIFQDVLSKLGKMESGAMSKEQVIEVLGFKLWTTTPEQSFRTFVNWGRYAGLVSYDADTQEVRLVPQPKGDKGEKA